MQDNRQKIRWISAERAVLRSGIEIVVVTTLLTFDHSCATKRTKKCIRVSNNHIRSIAIIQGKFLVLHYARFTGVLIYFK